MRQRLLREGAKELSYEIRGIVRKAHQIQALGHTIFWENIGDPVQKHYQMPDWIKEIVVSLVQENTTFGYCDSKGVLETRQFLAKLNNERNGAQVTEEDILFFNGLGDAIGKLYQYLVPTFPGNWSVSLLHYPFFCRSFPRQSPPPLPIISIQTTTGIRIWMIYG